MHHSRFLPFLHYPDARCESKVTRDGRHEKFVVTPFLCSQRHCVWLPCSSFLALLRAAEDLIHFQGTPNERLQLYTVRHLHQSVFPDSTPLFHHRPPSLGLGLSI